MLLKSMKGKSIPVAIFAGGVLSLIAMRYGLTWWNITIVAIFATLVLVDQTHGLLIQIDYDPT
jgi:hypothetical protein